MKSASEYLDKTPDYFNFDRNDVLNFIPKNLNARALEIGAADGSTLVALKREGKAGEVIGVELLPLPGAGQTRGEIDRFIIADIEEKNLDLVPNSFDVLICGDVLEHLRDPWGVLAYLTTLMRTDAIAVISLPNILYWRASLKIISGDFRYASSGVLDKTHLRFFCKKNIIELVDCGDLNVLRIEPSFLRQKQLKRDRLLNTLTLGLLERFFAQQYVVLAKKK
jgi:2-polyprenyl-3-methyl-5-hydroxy-6-metoxy-1,4-benzoquinol methylase